MTGRGVDQILPHPAAPEIFEPAVSDAREYVEMAEAVSGAIPRPVDFAYVWGDALETLRRADARIVNLETSVTANGTAWPGKGISYRMHPDNVPCLTAARIDVCTLANNHVMDWGRAGLIDTLDALHRGGIETVGAGRTLDEAQRFAVVDLLPGRVAVFGLAAASSGIPGAWAADAHRSGVWLLRHCSEREADVVGERVARVRQPGDVVVASIHWGGNWGYEVDATQVSFAHALIERGVDVVHGHSSHHPRPIEIYRDKLVLYGCGDFIDDYEGIEGHEGFRDDLALGYLPRLDRVTGKLLELRMVPMCRRNMRLRRASGKDAAWLAETLSRIGHPFDTRVAVEADSELILLRGG